MPFEELNEIPNIEWLMEQNPSLRGVFFDMDGTIFDTERVHLQVIQNIIQEVIPSADINAKKFCGLADGQVYLHLCQYKEWTLNFPSEESFITYKNQIMHSKKEDDFSFPEQMRELILAIKHRNLTCALVTSSETVVAHELLTKNRIIKFFNPIICREDPTANKPHPAPYLMALNMTHLEPKHCIVFEDSEVGIASAKAAKIKTYRALWFPPL